MKKNNINENTVYQRLRIGWDREKIFNTPNKGKGFKNNHTLSRKYPDYVFTEIEKNNISYGTFHKRVNKYNWDIDKACRTPVRKSRQYKRHRYSKMIIKLLNKNNISYVTFTSRVNSCSWKVLKAATTPVRRQK